MADKTGNFPLNGNGKRGPVALRSAGTSANGTSKKPAASRRGSKSKPKRAKKVYTASIYSRDKRPLPAEFVQLIRALEAQMRMPIWFVIQNEEYDESGRRRPDLYANISLELFKAFQKARAEMPQDKPVALLLESSGGDGGAAFRIARLLQRRSNNFTVIVPQYAKSAATLLALGARHLYMARQAELGPLDVQMFDPHKEEMGSALNDIQSLERLNAFSMTAMDQMMQLLRTRFGRKIDVSLPLVLDYATKFARPLLEKIDTVDYVRKSRELKVAEDYATRLMMPHYPMVDARAIARRLVQAYPTHGFVIDREEAEAKPRQGGTYGVGLRIKHPSEKAEAIMRDMVPHLDSLMAVGRVVEASV